MANLTLVVVVLCLVVCVFAGAPKENPRKRKLDFSEAQEELPGQEEVAAVQEIEPSITWYNVASKLPAVGEFMHAVVFEAMDIQIFGASAIADLMLKTKAQASLYRMKYDSYQETAQDPLVHKLRIKSSGRRNAGNWKVSLYCSEDGNFLEAVITHSLWNGYKRIFTPGHSFKEAIIDLQGHIREFPDEELF